MQLQIQEPAKQNRENLLISNFLDNFVKRATQICLYRSLEIFPNAERQFTNHRFRSIMAIMTAHTDKNAIEQVLSHGVEEVIDRGSLAKKLASGRRLIVKLGADPSHPDLHLGHAVVLRKLKEFQDLGHRVVFVIGDFTAMIGDPSGRASSRKPLSAAEVKKNSATYFRQAGKILDIKQAEIRKNSEWFSKMRLKDILAIAAHFSLRRIIDREDFQKRIKAGGEVGLHEAFYQVLQAYDSVALNADIEIGGRDQRLNMLAGRELQKKMGRFPQDIIAAPLLIGLDGTQKMSKSLGNAIGLADAPEDMFGKVMSVPDALIFHYGEIAAFFAPDDLASLKAEISRFPYEAKRKVARAVVRLYHGEVSSQKAEEVFRARFAKKAGMPEAYEEKKISAGKYSLLHIVGVIAPGKSKTELRRLIIGGAVEVDHVVLRDPSAAVTVADGEKLLRIGKKIFASIRAK